MLTGLSRARFGARILNMSLLELLFALLLVCLMAATAFLVWNLLKQSEVHARDVAELKLRLASGGQSQDSQAAELRERLSQTQSVLEGLRSAVSARREETLGIRYFGEDYRAHVAPLDGLNGSNWSIVTLFDSQLTRTVNIEWLVTTMLFTIIYAVLYIVVCIVVLIFRPAYRAPWLWPDPAHRREYQHLVVVYLVFAVAFVVAVGSLRGRHLLAFA